MDSEQSNKSRWWRLADRIGATASFLCAIHCALLPFVLALLPFLGLEFLADHRFERGFVLFACALALVALVRGFRRHQQPLPLLLAAPVLALMLRLPPEGHIPLLLSLALSTPILSLLGGLGAALTLGARRGGVLLTFLVLPLYVPALILGAAGLDASLTGAGGAAHWLILGGLDIAALALCPWATAAALREVSP